MTNDRDPSHLLNATRSQLVAAHVIQARSIWERAAGLLALPKLRPGEALWLEPCGSIHTWGMRYPLDVLFLNSDLRVLSVWRDVRPWRIAWAPRGTHSAIELLSGGGAAVERGDVLQCLRPPRDVPR